MQNVFQWNWFQWAGNSIVSINGQKGTENSEIEWEKCINHSSLCNKYSDWIWARLIILTNDDNYGAIRSFRYNCMWWILLEPWSFFHFNRIERNKRTTTTTTKKTKTFINISVNFKHTAVYTRLNHETSDNSIEHLLNGRLSHFRTNETWFYWKILHSPHQFTICIFKYATTDTADTARTRPFSINDNFKRFQQ